MIDSEQTVPDRLAELTRHAHSVTNASASATLHSDGRRRLLTAALDLQPGRRVVFGRATIMASFAAALASAVLLAWSFRARPLTYEIRGGQRIAANYVDALRDTPASVDFSDGSQIVAAAGSRLRIDATNERGARVFVERGSARAHVVHREHSSWVFIAGPFDVHITGTRFTLAWDPHEQAIDLTLHEGSVAVDSPLGSTHCVLSRGQRFRASLAAGTMQLENSDGRSASLGPPSDLRDLHGTSTPTPTTSNPQSKSKHALSWAVHARAQASASEPSPASKPGSASKALDAHNPTVASEPGHGSEPSNARQPSETGKAAESRSTDWPSLVRRGDFAAVVDAATMRGIEITLRVASAADVRALADAARYTGHAELAERSLSALRNRFPGTRQSAAAAFLLGRTLESSGGMHEADRFYSVYLSESPDGEFASEALAGHMRALAALQGPLAAKPVALEYLRRYRAGVHAETARRLANGN
jgi:TolA-binding protein